MLDYEILILGHDAQPTAFVDVQQGGDDDAIRVAQRIANGRPFEVWRDITRVYRVPPSLSAPPHVI